MAEEGIETKAVEAEEQARTKTQEARNYIARLGRRRRAWRGVRRVELDGRGWGPCSMTAWSSSASHVASLSPDPAIGSVMIIVPG